MRRHPVAGWLAFSGGVWGAIAGCGDGSAAPAEGTGRGGAAGSEAGSLAAAGTAGAGASTGGASAGANSGGVGAAGGTGGIDALAGAGGDAAQPATKPFDWVGVVGTGQSLSIGATAGFISLTQPYDNLTLLDSGSDPKYPLDGGQPQWSLVPLIEPVRSKVTGNGAGYSDGQYPNNIGGETPHSGMANTLTQVWQQRTGEADYVSVHSVVGWSGHCLVDIDKAGGKRAYPATLTEAKAIAALAKAEGKSFGYGGIIMTHGECDATTAGYDDGLYQLLEDYNADLKAITGQTRDIVMLVSQQSTKATGVTGSGVQVFQAGVEHPGELICTGPKYQYQYSTDKLHLGAAGYRRLGEKYAQIFDYVVNQGQSWQPLQPLKATRSGNVVKVDFHVPAAPLVWSEHIAPPHQSVHTEWSKGRGFEVATAEGAPVSIASAGIDGSAVLLTLQNPPAAGVALTVGYALTQDGEGNQGGDVLGLRGLLRDSDPFVGVDVETISVEVTQGSATIAAKTPGAFRRRTGYDIVMDGETPTGLIVTRRDSDDELVLSAPWAGQSGTRDLTFHYDLYNYSVHFSLAVQ